MLAIPSTTSGFGAWGIISLITIGGAANLKPMFVWRISRVSLSKKKSLYKPANKLDNKKKTKICIY